jgi:hypothetical protein
MTSLFRQLHPLMVIKKLEGTRRCKSRDPLLKVLDLYHPYPHPMVKRVINKLAGCGQKVVKDGVQQRAGNSEIGYWDRRHQCGSPFCPACSVAYQRKRANKLWDRLEKKVGSNPKRANFHRLRIDIAIMNLGDDPSGDSYRFGRKLKHMLTEYFPESTVCGGFHLKVIGSDVKLHFHG